jgi:sigma-B regulation protein RsbU (phosphoserine phosphatase)
MKLFNPAIALMNRLKYPQKFVLISFLFALPLALVMISLIREINYKIETHFGKRDSDGGISKWG